MGFSEAIRSAFNKYVTFSGRARRSEYWWFALFCILGNIVAGIVDAAFFGIDITTSSDEVVAIAPSVVGGIFSLAVFLPSLAVTVRRLHDSGRSGWWLLIILIPVIGILVLLYWMIRRGDVGDNAFGPDPIEGASGLPPAIRS